MPVTNSGIKQPVIRSVNPFKPAKPSVRSVSVGISKPSVRIIPVKKSLWADSD